MSTDRRREIFSGVRDLGPTGSLLAFLLALYTGILPIPKESRAAQGESDGVTLGELVRTVSRVEGAVNTINTTLASDVKTLDRRVIQLEISETAQVGILAQHGRDIRELQAKCGLGPKAEP